MKNMIDWKNERTWKNYCGYCADYTCPCNGDCLSDEEWVGKEKLKENRIDHIKEHLPIAQHRLDALKESLESIQNDQ